MAVRNRLVILQAILFAFAMLLAALLKAQTLTVGAIGNISLVVDSRVLLTPDDGQHGSDITRQVTRCGTSVVAGGLILDHTQPELAEVYWQDALDLCEGNAFIFIHAGDSAFNAGRYQLAAERWGRTEVSRQHVLSRIQSTIQSADWKAVSALAEILAATWPQAALGDYYHGLALMNLGDMRGAREALEQAADHIPSAGLEQQTAAEILQTLGRVYRYTGEDGLAESTLRAAIEADPLNSTAYVDMALLYRKANVRAALDMAKKAAEVNPKDVWAYLTIGDLALDTGEPQLALDMAKIAMSLQPNSSIPHLYAARASQMLGEYDLAFEFIEEGLVISSSSASAQQLLCYRLRISEEWEDNTQIALSRTKMAERGVDESLCK